MKTHLFAQEVSAAIQKVYNQGFAAMTPQGKCFYSHEEDDTRCVIGHLMTDDEAAKYRGVLKSIGELLKNDFRSGVYTHKQAKFLSRIQRVHDVTDPEKDFQSQWVSRLMDQSFEVYYAQIWASVVKNTPCLREYVEQQKGAKA